MKYLKALAVIFLMILFVAPLAAKEAKIVALQPTTFPEVAQYIKQHQHLPGNFITKKAAKKLGWEPSRGNLWDVAPGKSIGGDVFNNRENRLPAKWGRLWYEADIHYKGGKRGKDRILFSNDGLIYKTEDHYRTFLRMY